jgi:hypothetical protein
MKLWVVLLIKFVDFPPHSQWRYYMGDEFNISQFLQSIENTTIFRLKQLTGTCNVGKMEFLA